MATRAPEFKNLKATALPTPEEAPVMSTRLRAKVDSWEDSISPYLFKLKLSILERKILAGVQWVRLVNPQLILLPSDPMVTQVQCLQYYRLVISIRVIILVIVQ